MQHLVFVYGTLLAGEVNHYLLAGAERLGSHRTEPRFTLIQLGAYPGLITGGHTAVRGEVYRVDGAGLKALDRLEDYPRLYDRQLIATRFGRAWTYLYRGAVGSRRAIPTGDWRDVSGSGGSIQATAVRGRRDSKNPEQRRRVGRQRTAGENHDDSID
ncbi:MAG: gamma-glutamylcyclotransferase [Gammaproteobacteria bacterium]|jgi:gamma-glutamylcyclotransferase (GGCT)/AIG2-like uncharacterized protein YtfP|nr:gamma-glutamylcyclotransferase [Gammaproteobacteria bacterium]